MKHECPLCKVKTYEGRCPDCGMYLAECPAAPVRTAAPPQRPYQPGVPPQAQGTPYQPTMPPQAQGTPYPPGAPRWRPPARAPQSPAKPVIIAIALLFALFLFPMVVILPLTRESNAPQWDGQPEWEWQTADFTFDEYTYIQSEPLVQEEEGWIGDYYVRILSVERGRDRWERDSVIVALEWTNGNDGERAFSKVLRCWVYRDGSRLMGTLWENDADDMLEYMEIPPGETQVVRCIYELDVAEGPIYVECNRVGWSDTVVRTFETLE